MRRFSTAVLGIACVLVTGAGCSGEDEQATPLVMLLLDTSGSMERTLDCECADLACANCLPDCARAQRNRFALTLEALTGRYQDFTCESLERTEDNGATFDLDYYLPYHRPPVGAPQDDDGLLDRYASTARFGLASFDGMETYLGANRLVPVERFDEPLSTGIEGQWSYGSIQAGELREREDGRTVGALHYPNCTTDYRIDTGVRGPDADEGALIHAANQTEMATVNAAIQADLQRIRPYGGTPIAAALDDLHFYFAGDPAIAERMVDEQAQRHVILLTDGEPDSDYRDLGCDCNETGDASDPERCGAPPNDPAGMFCPYPRAAAAAAALVSEGVASVHVVLLVDGSSAGDVRAALTAAADEIAEAGGTDSARVADDADSLQASLRAILDGIVE